MENEVPIITAKQIKAAIDIGNYLSFAVIELFSKYGKTELAKAEERVLGIIKNNQSGLTKSEINDRVGFSYKRLQSILKTLLSGELIRLVKQERTYEKTGKTRTVKVYKTRYV